MTQIISKIKTLLLTNWFSSIFVGFVMMFNTIYLLHSGTDETWNYILISICGAVAAIMYTMAAHQFYVYPQPISDFAKTGYFTVYLVLIRLLFTTPQEFAIIFVMSIAISSIMFYLLIKAFSYITDHLY